MISLRSILRANISRPARSIGRISPTRYISISPRVRAASFRRFQQASIFGGISLGLVLLGSMYAFKPDVLALEGRQPLGTPAAKSSKVPSGRVIPFQEVEKHNNVKSAWIIVHGKVSICMPLRSHAQWTRV
jgi:hypothetical protein